MVAIDRKTLIGFGLVVFILCGVAASSFLSTSTLSKSNEAWSESFKTLSLMDNVFSLVRDAETGQRGYLLTGRLEYLKPYDDARSAIENALMKLRKSTSANSDQAIHMTALEKNVRAKFAELRETVEMRRSGESNEALDIVFTNRGKILMDQIRENLAELKSIESLVLKNRTDQFQNSVELTILIGLFGSLIAITFVLVAIFRINRDISRRQLAESQVREFNLELEKRIALRTSELESKSSLLSTVLEQMPAAVIVAEAPSGNIILANRQVETVWRHQLIKSKNVGGYGEWIGFHPDGRRYEGKDWPLARAISKGEVIKEETSVQFGDGTRGTLILSAAPIKKSDGQISAAIVICEDITEIKNAEHDRIKALGAEKAAVLSAKMKSEFLANMSHEIRTPLNGILGMTDLLLESTLDETQTKYASIVRDSGQGLLTVVNDILDFSKIEAGKLELEQIDFSIVDLIEGQVDLLASRAALKGISLMSFADPTIPRINGDPGRVGQVLLNLIGNAIKFTETGHVQAKATLKSRDQNEVSVLFEVIDTGIGLSDSNQQKLFQPFIQADGSTARKYGGTGLGLSISKKLIELMQGTIEVQSTLGRGSCFSFQCNFGIAKSLPKTRTEGADLSNTHVLIVDDDPPTGEIIAHYLKNWGVEAVHVNSGERALALLNDKQKKFTLALIDYRMPDRKSVV